MRILVVEDKIKMARLIQRGLFSFSELLARLRALARRDPGEVLSRFHLLEQAWDCDYENRSNVIDVYVRYLRRKIDLPFGTRTIETVRGSGYRLHSGGAPARAAHRGA